MPAGPGGGLAAYRGTLFGSASQQGTNGIVFAASKSGAVWTLDKIYTFANSADGTAPYGLVADANGTLFGATGEGGANFYYGTIFKLQKSGNAYKHTILHSMNRADGDEPLFVTMDGAGAIYGSTTYGGTSTACGSLGCGVVYKLTPGAGGSYAYRVLYSFKGGSDGLNPDGRLLVAGNGVMYGVTQSGGILTSYCTQGCGTIFALTPSGKSYRYQVLYRFAGGADGYFPRGGVVFGTTAATRGTLYGVTSLGGDVSECYSPTSLPGCGSIYSFAGGKKKTLYGFRGYQLQDGEIPASGVLATPTGLIGTTSLGGAQTSFNSVGTLWSIAYSASGYRTLHNFDGTAYATDGRSPDGPLTQVGRTYYTSMDQGGGSKACGFYGCGVIVEFSQ